MLAEQQHNVKMHAGDLIAEFTVLEDAIKVYTEIENI